jgi:sortase A
MFSMATKSKTKKRKAKKGAPKAIFSFRRHIVPPFIGLGVMFLVFLALNAQLIDARIKYHFYKPLPPAKVASITKQAVAKAPDPSAPPSITIPRIGLSAPVVFEQSTADWAVQQALLKGVDHYGSTAIPGQPGNAVIFGHSSGELWAPGKYKYAFTLLDKVQAKDQVIVVYKGVNYIYSVTSTEVILPTNLSILNQNQPAPSLTLVTCSPIGTNKYRLVVHAVQTSPVPQSDIVPKPQLAVKAQPALPDNAHYSFWRALTSWL